jgi:hypothetical protein
MTMYYKLEKQTLESVFRYLRRQPHEEVDLLLHEIKAKAQGPFKEPARKPRGRRLRKVKAGRATS